MQQRSSRKQKRPAFERPIKTMIKIIDLIKQCPYENVEKKIVLYYGDEYADEFRKLYSELEQRVIQKPVVDKITLVITVRRDNGEGTDPAVDSYDESDPSIYFDVSGVGEGVEMLYSIASASFDEFIQFTIDDKTSEKFAVDSILAHALWELTGYGFEDKA